MERIGIGSIAVFQDTFQGISCTFQYISQYEFRAEQPPIPVYNSNSEKDTHISGTVQEEHLH